MSLFKNLKTNTWLINLYPVETYDKEVEFNSVGGVLIYSLKFKYEIIFKSKYNLIGI